MSDWQENIAGAPRFTGSEIRELCDFLYRRTGLSYDESKRYYIERRVVERMQRVGLQSFSSYMVLAKGSREESQHLINSFTVNETYFYREIHQLQCLSGSMLPEVVAGRRAGDLVRIWCVPCSTGEEPYSLAIWLLENWNLVDAYHIQIVGSDIDTRVLSDALVGRYGERALSRLPPALVERYFDPVRDGRRQIIGDLRESVKFTQVNLMDVAAIETQGKFDIIFCRNVLIYFDDASRLTVADHIFDSLSPGGFICLGASESMTRISDRFAARRFADAIVHQRPVE